MSKTLGLGLLLLWGGIAVCLVTVLFGFAPQLLLGGQLCPVNEGGPTPCMVGGHDVGEFLNMALVFSIVGYVLFIPASRILILLGLLFIGVDYVHQSKGKRHLGKRTIGSVLAGLTCIGGVWYFLYYLPVHNVSVPKMEQEHANEILTVEFRPGTDREAAYTVSAKLKEEFGVTSIRHMSPEERLEEFKKRHANDPLTIQAIEESDYDLYGSKLEIQTESEEQRQEIFGWIQLWMESYSIESVH